LTEGQTVEQAAEHYIELTKAYKALTDEVVRKNFLEYGHPDGKQTVQVVLALPPWVVDAHNNIWVLGMYGVVIGGVLPYIVVCVLSLQHCVLSKLWSGQMVVRLPLEN
jgi:translocation protein SEC63